MASQTVPTAVAAETGSLAEYGTYTVNADVTIPDGQ